MRSLLLLLAAGAAPAQQWEVGAALGYGIYRNASIYAPAGKAAAGVRNRFTAGAVFAEDPYEHLGGELRYTYQDGDPFLERAGVRANVQGQSHAFHYDVLVHLRPRGARVRPYFAAGAGVKLYRVTGPENPSQPLSNIGLLASADDWRPLVSIGPGVKIRMHEHVLLRADFRDYITPFPSKIIAPARFATGRGLLQQFTPMAGISYVF